jgi:hypothetical protein
MKFVVKNIEDDVVDHALNRGIIYFYNPACNTYFQTISHEFICNFLNFQKMQIFLIGLVSGNDMRIFNPSIEGLGKTNKFFLLSFLNKDQVQFQISLNILFDLIKRNGFRNIEIALWCYPEDVDDEITNFIINQLSIFFKRMRLILDRDLDTITILAIGDDLNYLDPIKDLMLSEKELSAKNLLKEVDED